MVFLIGIESFTDIPFWIISKEQVIKWWKKKQINCETRASRQTIVELLSK